MYSPPRASSTMTFGSRLRGVRIEFTYARGPDHFVEPSGPPARGPSPIPSYVLAGLLVPAGVAFAIAAFVYGQPQTALCGLCGTLLGALIAIGARQRGRTR